MDEMDVDEQFVEARYLLRRSAEDAQRARAALLALTESGVPLRTAADRMGVPKGTLTHWMTLARAEREGTARASLTRRR